MGRSTSSMSAVEEKPRSVDADGKPQSVDEVVTQGFRQIFGNGEYRLKWGVIREKISEEERARMDAEVDAPERVAMREAAACSLTNIGAEERQRRTTVGYAGGVASLVLLYLVRDINLVERALVMYPFVALSLGFAVSGREGL